MSDGEMQNEDVVRACKLYALQEIAKHCRGKISLTDIDGGVYVGHCGLRQGRMLLVEFKTEGAEAPAAQLSALEFLVEKGGGDILLVVAEHPPLDLIEPKADVIRFQLCGLAPAPCRALRWSEWIEGKHFALLFERFYGDLDCLNQIAQRYFQEARHEQ